MKPYSNRGGRRKTIRDGQYVQVMLTPQQKRYLKTRGFGNLSQGLRYVLDACIEPGIVVLSADEYVKLTRELIARR